MDTDRMRSIGDGIFEANHAYAHRAGHALEDAADEIERLRDLIADMPCDCLPHAVPYDGMCRRCMAIGGHLEPSV